MNTPRHLTLVAAILSAIALAACGGSLDGTSTTGSTTEPATASTTGAPAGTTTTPPVPTGIDHPTDPNTVILKVNVGGGFVPVEYNLASVPSYSLYGDGTLVTPGPITLEYPGAARTPMFTQKLDEAAIQEILIRARDAGLLTAPTVPYGDMGTIGISDAPTTVLTITADGSTVTHEAYALEMGADAPGVPADVAAARKNLAGFIASLGAGGGTEPYVPAAVEVWVGPYAGEPQPGQAPVVWPLSSNLTAMSGETDATGYGTCTVVEGADATTLLDTVDTKTNAATQWIAAADQNTTYRVVVRPVLPGETPCGDHPLTTG